MYLLLIGSLLVLLQLQSFSAAPGVDDPEPLKPSATIAIDKITKDDYQTLERTGRLSIIQQNTGIYVPGPIKYPCGETWSSWWARNYWYFQCQANMACRPYRSCWCNRCACYLFIVNPQNPPCRPWIPWATDISSIKVDAFLELEAGGGK